MVVGARNINQGESMQEVLVNYLQQIKGIDPTDKEHTHRTSLDRFVIEIKDKIAYTNIKIIHEPNNDKEGRGAPDFLITKDSLTLGYIENKRINADLDSISQSPQIEKYLRLSDNLMLTDYLRFCLVRRNDKGNAEIVRECRICELSQLQALAKNPKLYDLDSKTKELAELFTLFFSQSPSPINTAKEFANALAQRTRILKDEMIEKQSNAHIQGLFNAFKESLYKDLEFITFADSFAQTLTYSLFLARLNSQNEAINLDNAYNFIPKSFSLIQAMSKFLRELKELDSIKWLLEEIIAIINHIDISEIIKDLNKISQKDLLGESIYKDPYLHLYEDFLKEYDESLREVRGVYYTPAPVVRFIIDSIDLTLQKDFDKQEGLKSAINDSDITLLDFATGTGTFLLEAFRKALESSNKSTPSFVLKSLLQRFYGFEFLIAPYTIAHLKISQVLKEEFDIELEYNKEKKECESLNIALTNTLYVSSKEDEVNKQSNLFVGMAELTKEFEKAQEIKSKDILIITGNPPYSGASANKGLYEDEVRITYGLEPKLATLTKAEQQALQRYFANKSKDNAKTFKSIFDRHKLQNEKNPKMLLDDYVKFIRFAESKIEKQEGGIFAFISNNSFLDNPTFRGMRYHLLQSFDRMYILDLHGNTRKKETAPSGDKDDNVFDIMQGVSINIFIKTKSLRGKAEAIHTQTKAMDCHEATAYQNDLAQIYHYDLYGKRKDKYNFLAKNTLDSIEWEELKPQEPFYLFVPQNENLRAEYDKGYSIKDMFRISSVGVATGKDSVFTANTQEMLKNQILDVFDDFDESFIKEINYRPFDKKLLYFDLKKINRPRMDVMEHFLRSENVGLIYDRGTNLKEVSNLFISSEIIDKHLVGANSYISPLYLYPTRRAKKTLKKQGFDITSFDTKIENFTPSFREFIDSTYKEHFSPQMILGYIYALLFHKEYREKYLDFLKVDFPKIPFVESKELFLEFSTLGNSLISLHLLQDNALDSNIGKLQKIGKDESKIIEKPSYNAESKRLFINKSLYFEKVESSVWEYKIGGYQVLDKYLKSHKGEEIDFTYFQKIIQTLHKSLEIEREIVEIKLV